MKAVCRLLPTLAAIGGVVLAFFAYAAFTFSDTAVRILDGALLTWTRARISLPSWRRRIGLRPR